MSGPNPPDGGSLGEEPGDQPTENQPTQEVTGATESVQAYSAPESEQFTSGPYVPADPALYEYDTYDPATELVDQPKPPRWPWVVGITAILAAIVLVASVSLLVTHTDTSNLSNPVTTAPAPPVTTTATTPAGPRQVTYSVTGTKAPGDIITVTYVDASGRRRTQRNVYIPWSLTVTPISTSDVGSVEASSLFLVSRLNCSITTSDGTVLSSNTNNSAQTSC